MANWFNVFKNLVSPGRPSEAAPLRINTRGLIHYTMNDPSTPELFKLVPVPSLSDLPFTVDGYQGGGHQPYTKEGRAAQVHVVITNTLDGIQNAIGEPLHKWSLTSNLEILPRVGRMFNAYYDRESLSFFYDRDLVQRKDVYACDSHDIVAHELGHALLDAYRPDIWNIASIEVAAYHEAFADTIAFLSSMFNDEVLCYILNQTKGNLFRDHVGCCLASEFGLALFHDYRQGFPTYLRNLNNDFAYANPIMLPDHGSDNKIVAQPYSFSRIMSGAYYEIFVMIYRNECGRGIAPIEAMKNARNVLCRYLFQAIRRIALHTRFFQSAAYAMLEVDAFARGPYQAIIRNVFTRREIINGNHAMTSISTTGLHRPCRHLRLRESLPIRKKALNPLYDVSLDVPNDGIEGVLAAHDFVQYLHKNKLVNPDSRTPFRICDGKLFRVYFA